MKLKSLLTTLLGILILQHAAIAQTNFVPDAVAAGATNMAAAGSSGDAASALPSSAIIPLIKLQDAPLTTAIQTLARQAGLNYLLDPKIGYGQPDANGQIKTEPTLTIRWENVTAEHALEALLDNYGLQMITDSKTSIVRITTKDPAALPPLITRVIQLKYAGTSNMVDAAQSTLTDKRSRVIADNRTSQLIVVATDPEQTAVDTLINELDTATREVLIETRLVEISANPTSKKGIDWSQTLSGQNLSAGNYSTFLVPPTAPSVIATTPPTIVPGSPGLVSGLVNQSPSILGNSAVNGFFQNPWYLNADGLHAVLSFLNSSADAQVTSTPRVVTLDNETATISVIRALPILNATAGTLGSPGGSSISYSNVGTTLLVTPRISANDTIRLKVTPTVSSLFGYVPLTAAGSSSTAPEFDSRTLDTQVLIPNASTLVMGGMVKDNPNSTQTKVPLLGDIPGLGYMFRSSSKSTDKDNLLIFITPTILQASDFHPTTTDFLQAQPVTEKATLNPNSIWDSARPYNWSDPQKTDPNEPILDQKATQ